MTGMNKKELRRRLRALHQGATERDRQSAMLCRHILESGIYRSARVIGGYMPMPREADITPILLDALQRGKTLALPLCGDAPHMSLRRVSSLEELTTGTFGILEPRDDAPVVPVDEVELLLIPLEGIDAQGFRLGKGGGYYDCLLQGCGIPTMGCALQWQWTAHVPREAWDVPLSACADCCGIHEFKNDQ